MGTFPLRYLSFYGQRIIKVGRFFLSSAILLSFLLIIWRKNVFFGHLTYGIVLSEQEDISAFSQEKWHSGIRGSYVSLHSRGRRFLAARIPLCPRFPFKAKVLRCCRLNMRSLPVHLDEVGTLILLNNLDVFAVSETWFAKTEKRPLHLKLHMMVVSQSMLNHASLPKNDIFKWNAHRTHMFIAQAACSISSES